MLERSLHFPIAPGVVAAWNTRTVVIVALLDRFSTRVRDVATGEGLEVPVEELQGIPAIGQLETKEDRWALVRDSTRAEWKQARRRERVLRKLISRDSDSSEDIEFACKALNLSGAPSTGCSPIIVLPHKRPLWFRNTAGHPLPAGDLLPLAKPLRCAASSNAISVGPELPSHWLWRK
jgi:hypothetical protein